VQEQVGPGVYWRSPFSAGANLVIQLKETYQVISQLKDQSGFAWDELKGATITIESEDNWRAYVLVRSFFAVAV
jgi:hypothetical protein